MTDLDKLQEGLGLLRADVARLGARVSEVEFKTGVEGTTIEDMKEAIGRLPHCEHCKAHEEQIAALMARVTKLENTKLPPEEPPDPIHERCAKLICDMCSMSTSEGGYWLPPERMFGQLMHAPEHYDGDTNDLRRCRAEAIWVEFWPKGDSHEHL